MWKFTFATSKYLFNIVEDQNLVFMEIKMIADYLPRNKFRGNNISKAYGFFKFVEVELYTES